MYTVIGGVRSRAMRVLWMLEELGLSYEHQPVTARSDEARAVNPTGKIPALIEDGTVLTDSTAIIQYLADKHGALTFPAGTLERARQDGLTQFILDEMDAILWTAARHSFVLPEEHRVPEVKTSLKWEFSRAQSEFMRRLGDGPFLMGETMTVPDILAVHCGGWAINARFEITDPGFEAYVKRLRQRPAFQAAAAR